MNVIVANENKSLLSSLDIDVIKSIDQNIKAEQDAIETYNKLEKITRDKDVVSNQKIKEILADEQEHLQALIECRDNCQYRRQIKESKNGGTFNYLNYVR